MLFSCIHNTITSLHEAIVGCWLHLRYWPLLAGIIATIEAIVRISPSPYTMGFWKAWTLAYGRCRIWRLMAIRSDWRFSSLANSLTLSCHVYKFLMWHRDTLMSSVSEIAKSEVPYPVAQHRLLPTLCSISTQNTLKFAASPKIMNPIESEAKQWTINSASEVWWFWVYWYPWKPIGIELSHPSGVRDHSIRMITTHSRIP